MTDNRPLGKRCSAGNTQIEFALCAVFIVFLLISIVDLARGMWIYHTLAEAVRDGTRHAIVRGDRYVDPVTGNRLAGATLADARAVVLRHAAGLDPNQLNLRFESPAGTITCNPATNCPGGSLGQTWPPVGFASAGLEVGIIARYPYNSLVVMYFPGGGGLNFGNYTLGSSSRERIVF